MNENPQHQRSRPTPNRRADLFEPTLQEYGSPWQYRDPPWSLDSQLYVAFFGGVLAIAAIAYLNGKRLLLPPSEQRKIIFISVTGFAATIASAILLNTLDVPDELRPGEIGFRMVGRVIAVVTYLFLRRIQKSAFRVYVASTDGELASLWVPGLLAVFGVGLVEGLILSASVAMTG